MATDCSLRVAWHLRFCLTCLARGERLRHATPTLATRSSAASAEECPDDASRRRARRQVRSWQGAHLPLRRAGGRPHASDAARARPARRPRTRPASFRAIAVRRSAVSTCSFGRPSSSWPSPTSSSSPASTRNSPPPPAGARSRRSLLGEGTHDGVFSRLVRQGAGRRPLRRRLPPRQSRRFLEAWRRAGADGRRPHGRSPRPTRMPPSSCSSTR